MLFNDKKKMYTKHSGYLFGKWDRHAEFKFQLKWSHSLLYKYPWNSVNPSLHRRSDNVIHFQIMNPRYLTHRWPSIYGLNSRADWPL